MEIKKGDEFLAIETGTVYVIHAVSKYGTQVVIKTKKNEAEFVVHMNPERIESILRLLRDKLWIPNTPAARTLYGYEAK